MNKLSLVFVFFSLLTPITVLSEPLLLTGTVKAKDNQSFYAPKTDTWQVQIKWMSPEGEIVNKGDLAVVFDSGSIESKIEQEEISLIAAQDEFHRLKKEGAQKILEAKYNFMRSELLVDRAQIDASIPKENLSEYDYQKYNVALEKALVGKIKNKSKFKQVQLSDVVALKKQQLKINKSKDSLNYNQNKLSKMALYAQRTGPLLYASHPWNGEKIFVGTTVRPSWEVAVIPSLSDLYIESWLHEVDYNKVKENQKANLRFDAYPNLILNSTLVQLSSQPDAKKDWGDGVYFKAIFSFTVTKETKLLPGMSAQLEVITIDNKDGLYE